MRIFRCEGCHELFERADIMIYYEHGRARRWCDACLKVAEAAKAKNDLGTELVEYAIIFGAVLLLSVSMSTFVSSCGKAFTKSQTQHYSCWTPGEPGAANPCRPD